MINYRSSNRQRLSRYFGRATDPNESGDSTTYFCDTYSPFAFYSVARQGKSDQTQMIEVRESGGGTYEWIGPAAGVLDETALLAHTGANSGYVRTVKDPANGRDATQTTAGSQPRIVEAGVVKLDNGKPAMEKPGVTDLSLATAAWTAISQPNTIFCVGQNDANTFQNFYDGIDTAYRHLLYWTGDTLKAYAGTQIASATGIGNGAQLLLTGLFNTTSSVYRKNGSEVLTGDVNTNQLTGLTLMNAFTQTSNSPKYLQEVILFDSDQTANFATIESDINTFYGVY